MSWVEHAIWWQVYPLGFAGAPIREPDPQPGPRLRRLVDWLDYAIELGASGLLLGPIFASESHGYDTLDFFRVDPRLGGDADFDHLIEQCRARGLRVLLDGVFSHVGRSHPEVRRALAEGPAGESAELFDIDWSWPEGPRPRVFEGHDSLVRLNHAGSAAVELTRRVMTYWLARGIDGWRLDAAYSVAPKFWRAVLPQVRAEFPEAWFLGEVIHGDYSAFVAESGVDSVTQYELWKALWSSLTDRNLFELAWALQRHNDFLTTFAPNTFVGNHDVTRIASRLGSRGAVTAAAILLTLGGIPSIYYGDEQGYTGVKEERIGGDDEVRPPFPATPQELSALGAPLLRAHQDLIGLRRRNPWLVTAKTAQLELTNTRLQYRSSSADGAAHLEVEVDLDSPTPVTIRDAHGEVAWQQRI